MSSPSIEMRTASVPARRPLLHGNRARLIFTVLAVGLAGFAVGYAATRNTPSALADSDLTLLLQFMAVIKLGMVAGAAWLIDWSLKHQTAPHVGTGYIVAVGLMAAAPGLIWFMTYIVAASMLFHAGLLLALFIGFREARFANGQSGHPHPRVIK